MAEQAIQPPKQPRMSSMSWDSSALSSLCEAVMINEVSATSQLGHLTIEGYETVSLSSTSERSATCRWDPPNCEVMPPAWPIFWVIYGAMRVKLHLGVTCSKTVPFAAPLWESDSKTRSKNGHLTMTGDSIETRSNGSMARERLEQ